MGSKGSYLITLPRRGSDLVLRVDYARWGHTPEDLRHLALSAPHTRTRERALALFEITQGRCATRLAARTGRHPQTVMGWVHAYNAQGPAALAFRRTGGRRPLTWGLLLSMGLVCMRGSSGLVRHGSVRRGPAGRSSPEASQRCAAGAGLDGAG